MYGDMLGSSQGWWATCWMVFPVLYCGNTRACFHMLQLLSLFLNFYFEPCYWVWSCTTHLTWSGEYLTTIILQLYPDFGAFSLFSLTLYWLLLVCHYAQLMACSHYLSLHCPAVSMLLWCPLFLFFFFGWFDSVHHYHWVSHLCHGLCTRVCMLCMDCMKCHSLLCSWSRIWLVSVSYFW